LPTEAHKNKSPDVLAQEFLSFSQLETYNFIPVWNDYELPSIMTIEQLYDLAHVMVGEQKGEQADDFAHVMYNREIETAMHIKNVYNRATINDEGNVIPKYGDDKKFL